MLWWIYPMFVIAVLVFGLVCMSVGSSVSNGNPARISSSLMPYHIYRVRFIDAENGFALLQDVAQPSSARLVKITDHYQLAAGQVVQWNGIFLSLIPEINPKKLSGEIDIWA